MALFNECTQSCARIVLDMAGIVRDGDLLAIQVADFSSFVEPSTRISEFSVIDASSGE